MNEFQRTAKWREWNQRTLAWQNAHGGADVICRNCGQKGHIYAIHCDSTCTNCGMVQHADRIVERAEWRTFSESSQGFDGGSSGNRCGMPVDYSKLDVIFPSGADEQSKTTDVDTKQNQIAWNPPPRLGLASLMIKKNRSDPHSTKKISHRMATMDNRTSIKFASEMKVFEDLMEKDGIPSGLISTAIDMYMFGRTRIQGIRSGAKDHLMGACLYLASKRTLSSQRIQDIFSIPKQKHLNRMIAEMTNGPFASAFSKTFDSHPMNVAMEYDDNAKGFYPSHHDIKRVVNSTKYCLEYACLFSPIVQIIVETSPSIIQDLSIETYAARALHLKTLRTRLKFRCMEIKAWTVASGMEGSYNPRTFNMGIALVASEELGLKGICASFLAAAFDHSGRDITILRNAEKIRAELDHFFNDSVI